MVRQGKIPFEISLNRPSVENRTTIEDAQPTGLESLRALQEESIINGTDSMTMEEIDAEIAAYRREKRGCQ